HDKTTVAYPVCEAPHGNVYVYDLRQDPTEWIGLSVKEVQKIVDTPYKERGEDYKPLPVKKLQYNRCPAVAPLGVLSQNEGWNRIGLSEEVITRHLKLIRENRELLAR